MVQGGTAPTQEVLEFVATVPVPNLSDGECSDSTESSTTTVGTMRNGVQPPVIEIERQLRASSPREQSDSILDSKRDGHQDDPARFMSVQAESDESSET